MIFWLPRFILGSLFSFLIVNYTIAKKIILGIIIIFRVGRKTRVHISTGRTPVIFYMENYERTQYICWWIWWLGWIQGALTILYYLVYFSWPECRYSWKQWHFIEEWIFIIKPFILKRGSLTTRLMLLAVWVSSYLYL